MNTRDAVPGLLDRQPEGAADEEVKVVGSCHWAKSQTGLQGMPCKMWGNPMANPAINGDFLVGTSSNLKILQPCLITGNRTDQGLHDWCVAYHSSFNVVPTCRTTPGPGVIP